MSENLKTTPLTSLHQRLEARMVPFAGYSMPVQYPSGLMQEHLHTRASAGLFDVSHMGQVVLRPRSGKVEDAARALESLVPSDVLGVEEGRQRYVFFTSDSGGILDDFMVGNRGDHLFLVVNASRKDHDLAHLRDRIGDSCEIELLDDRGLIALQGPKAVDALSPLAPKAAEMRFMDVAEIEVDGVSCIVSRAGYTGEDGFEISMPGDRAMQIAEKLLANELVKPVGLGARDSLRLEAALCLYGNDIDENVTPVEAGLNWAMQKVRRKGGEREGGFPGADVILEQLQDGAPRRRVGLRPEGRAPVRAGAKIHLDPEADAIGEVTSGVFAPSVEAPIAMGYVPSANAEIGTKLYAEVRGRHLPMTIVKMPFIEPGQRR